ncbi:hypothetical protein ABT297_00225 [Dactylosporangium sp. NPDC000555]|uniref:hypothetical protein n=1 Tax=Dactylosporangium sp. NPDC000555 TaxID=3154260 RepID=UPI00331BBBDB
MDQVGVSEWTASAPDPAVTSAQAVAETHLPRRRAAWWPEVRTVVTVAVLVGVIAVIPVWSNHLFYFWDDSGAEFLPQWYSMGEALRRGQWPILWPDMWMGGNLLAEGLYGVWNPVVLGNAVLITFMPDLALAALVLKAEIMAILAVGVYLLAREYGAVRWAAAVVAIAMPFAGFTLWHDASAWAAGLLSYAFSSYFWWATRLHLRGRLNPAVPFIFGYLIITVGNPAGVMMFLVIGAALGLERLLERDWKALVRLTVVGVAVGLVTFVVFYPIRATVNAVSWRSTSALPSNDGSLVPRLGDFLNLSSPTYLPNFPHWLVAMSTPVTYLAWFVIPLAPWLSWSALRRLRGGSVGPVVVGFGAMVLTLLPSSLWLFRYPVRFIDYLYATVGVCFALVLSNGLRNDLWRRRAAGTAAIVVVQAYLAWAVRPELLDQHLNTALVVAALVAGAVLAARWRPMFLSAVLVAGTAVVLAMQVSFFPANMNIYGWRLAHDIAEMRERFADRYRGNVLQISPVPALTFEDMRSDRAWRDMLMGNMYPVAGVRSLNSYSGIGFLSFSSALCMEYAGHGCPEMYDRLWLTEASTGRPLVDLLRIDTLVVSNRGTKPIDQAPNGWQVTERTQYVIVLKRTQPLPQPDGRVSWTDSGVTVVSDTARREPNDPGEDVRYRGSGRIMIAMLAWPGWRATVDGREVPVTMGPAGLVEVTVPDAGPDGGTLHLHFEPPGLRKGRILLILGVCLGLGYGVIAAVRRRPAVR